MKKIFITFLILLFIGIGEISAFFVSPKIEKIYSEKIVLKIEKKYINFDTKINVLVGLGKKIEKIKKFDKYKNNTKLQNLLEQILYLNNKQIKKYKKQKILQKILEKQKKEVESKSNTIRDIDSNKYEKEYLEEIEKNKKIINSYNYSKYFVNKIYNKDFLVLENGIWYSYFYKNIIFFENDSKITIRDLNYNNVDLKKSLLFVRKDNKLGIVKDYKKRKLISDYIIKDIKNKYYFLSKIKEDKKDLKNDIDYDNLFLDLQKNTNKITYNLSDRSKILNIYNYILKNISYPKIVNFSDFRQFSGIETFKNKTGVCSGYTKLMIYMLLFAGINDVEEIKGYVIDASDFPDVGHSWIRIRTNYYDPTFDDPVGLTKTKKSNEYSYFSLPKDLFYTNRYEDDDLPASIKKMTLTQRKNLIQKNLNNLYSKYKNFNYNLMKLIKFKKEHNILYSEKINLSNFEKILPKKVVNNFKFIENGNTKQIRSLKMFDITNAELESLLKQINYNLSGYYFFEWYNKDGKRSYRLAYDVLFR